MPVAAQHRLLRRRCYAEYVARRSVVRRAASPSHRPDRGRAADLRRRDDVQGGQGRPGRVRPTSSPCSVSAVSATLRCSTRDRRRHGRRGRRDRGEARRWRSELGADVHGERRDRGPRRRRSRRSEAPMRRSSRRRRSSRSAMRSARSAGAAGSSSSACRPGNELPLPIFETVLNGITVIGSIVGTRSTSRTPRSAIQSWTVRSAGASSTRTGRPSRRARPGPGRRDSPASGRGETDPEHHRVDRTRPPGTMTKSFSDPTRMHYADRPGGGSAGIAGRSREVRASFLSCTRVGSTDVGRPGLDGGRIQSGCTCQGVSGVTCEDSL